MQVKVETLFDKTTFTLTYIVFDEKSRDAVVIDPVWDYDQASSTISNSSLKKIVSFIEQEKLKLHFILETHIHADHLTASAELKKIFSNAKTAVSQNVVKVQEIFKKIYNLEDYIPDGSQFNYLFSEDEVLNAGSLKIRVIETPGHTPCCVSFVIDKNIFTGDALFMPDSGTGRCDFPGGDANLLFDSLQKIYALPDDFFIYTGHDYQPDGRELKFISTVAESKSKNIQIKADTTKVDFVSLRKNRDITLSAPKLLIPSIQVNMTGGVLPQPESNGVSYLKIPVTVKAQKDN